MDYFISFCNVSYWSKNVIALCLILFLINSLISNLNKMFVNFFFFDDIHLHLVTYNIGFWSKNLIALFNSIPI